MRRLFVAALACGLLAAGGAALRAEDKAEGGGKPGWRGHGPLAELTAEQRAALKAAKRAHRDAVTPLKDKLEDELERLRGLVEKAAPEKDLTASVDKVKELHKAMQAEREKFMEKMGSSLSPLQRAKGVLMMARRLKGGFAGHFGMGPGMGGHGMRGRGRRGHGGGGPGMKRGGGGWRDAVEGDDGAEEDEGELDEEASGPELP